MGDSSGPSKALSFQELTELRRKTEVISKFLHDQLAGHLETLRPVLSPERVFGKHVSGRGDSASADRAYAQLLQQYKPFVVRPFDLPSEFDQHWLSLTGTRLSLYPWEYAHQIASGGESKTISVASPVRWVVSYTSSYTLGQVRQALTGTGEARPEHVRQFVVNALVTQAMIAQSTGLASLFGDLRYQLRTEYAADLPKLPLTTITSIVPSSRPPDDMILAATGFSGVPAFVEVIDVGGLSSLDDPLKTRVEALLR
jgi:hypothetical protein